MADHVRAIVGLELELAQLEIRRKIGAVGLGAGLGLAAGALAFCAAGLLLAAAAAALTLVMPVWAATLIVGGGVMLLAALLGIAALAALRRGTPPVPEQAIEEAKLTTEALKSDGHR